MGDNGPKVVIVDYGMGNLFSVEHAFEHVGIRAIVSSSKEDVLAADAVVLPGVGAFGDAMATLHKLDLVEPLREIGASQTLLVGICLGMQLLMTESQEFGLHRGLGVFRGAVVPFSADPDAEPRIKVPHVGWSRVVKTEPSAGQGNGGDEGQDWWEGSPLQGLRDGEYLYFVHSYYPAPEDTVGITSSSRYAGIEFCSSLWQNNVFGCQFHPERSGPQGLKIYRNLVALIAARVVKDPERG